MNYFEKVGSELGMDNEEIEGMMEIAEEKKEKERLKGMRLRNGKILYDNLKNNRKLSESSGLQNSIVGVKERVKEKVLLLIIDDILVIVQENKKIII